MEINIGKLIEARLEEVGMSKAEFGRRIDTSRQNVNTLLRKTDMSVDLLRRIGRVLGKDFLAEYSPERKTRLEQKEALERGREPYATVLLKLWTEEQFQRFMEWKTDLE